MLNLNPITGGHEVFYQNRSLLGHILVGDDGFYNFWPDTKRGGYWDSQVLKLIAQQLDLMNAQYAEQMEHDLTVSVIREAFKDFSQVQVERKIATDITVIADDHSDDVYSKVSDCENKLHQMQPELAFDTHVRAKPCGT